MGGNKASEKVVWPLWNSWRREDRDLLTESAFSTRSNLAWMYAHYVYGRFFFYFDERTESRAHSNLPISTII